MRAIMKDLMTEKGTAKEMEKGMVTETQMDFVMAITRETQSGR